MEQVQVAAPALAWGDFAIMGVYFAVVVGLGILFSKKESTTDEYLLGGRRMPWWVIGISYMVTLMSTISLVAIPGEVYNNGMTRSLMTLMSPFVALATFYIFVRFYFRVSTFTPFAYLEHRFDRRVRLLGSLVFTWTRLAYLAMVMYSSSKVFEGAAGWAVWKTVLVIGAIGVFYTTLGGMKAVVWTDFVQFIILVVGMVVIVTQIAGSVTGGAVGVVTYAFENGHGFQGIGEPGFFSFSPYVRLTFWMMLIGITMEYMFYNSADQVSIQRLLSTSSYKEAQKSLFMYLAILVPFALLLWFIGLAVFSYYGNHPSEAVGVTGDTALFRYIALHLPTPLPGLVIAAMLAAVMSTLDSGMNSLATVATKDIYLEFVRRDATELEQVRFSRIMTVVVGVFAVVAALLLATLAESIKDTIMEANAIWGAYAAVLAPIFLIGVTTRKVKPWHIVLGCVSAWIVTTFVVIWYVTSKNGPNPVSFMFVPIPGLVVMLFVGYLPVFFPGRVDPEKTEGLTLWTLDKPDGPAGA